MTRLLVIGAVALVFAAPASAMRWLADSPGHTITPPADVTAEATSASGAVVTYPDATVDPSDESATCTPASGSAFAIGTTVVTCSAADANDATFNIVVQDTTSPTFGSLPSPTATTAAATVSVSWPDVIATDAVAGSITATCTPASGSEFPIGTTHVSCAASDGNSPTAHAGFDVVVSDSGAPTITIDAPPPAEATSASGASVSWSVHAGDNSGSVTVSCDHPSGSNFPIGTTSVTCTATDGAGNHTSTGPFDVKVQDTTKPALTVPGNMTVEADSSAGKVVTYSASASDLVSSVTANCAPASGSTFPVGTTTVNCTATDGANNQASTSFQVTVTDASGPAFSSVPGTVTAEANGPGGAIVSYVLPTAVDVVDGPQPVSCSPVSHTLFPLGTTTVHCTAADNHGNTSPTSFQVSVVDTTPPTLAIPGPTTVYATTPTGIPETASAFLAFRRAASADDIVDPHPVISDNLGSFAEVGTHGVGFVARDASGNLRAASTTLTVLPMPAAGTTPLPLPPPAKLPADIPNLQVFPGSGFVRLVWGNVAGAVNYLVYRSQGGARRLADGHGELVYKGTATTYTDRGLTNGVEYRYVVVSEDAAGNQSAGVAAAAMPHLNLLRSPKDGARLKNPPKFMWARNAEASYYNVQLYRGPVKILSSWPVGAALKLKRTWKYEGKRYTLTKGVYRWYVWPGFGARSAVDYGELLGSNSFQMIR